MSKSLAIMRHPNSAVEITVPRSQIKNAEYHGWVEVDAIGKNESTDKSEVKKNGNSKRCCR